MRRNLARPVALGLLVGLTALCGACAERRAERAFRRAAATESSRPLADVRADLQKIVQRWPETKAARTALSEIEWIDALDTASSRGPFLRAWDAVRRVALAVEAYREREGRIPADLQGLAPRYLPAPVSDPWGVPVRFIARPNGYRVVSYGADGLPGGSGDNGDIIVENGKLVHDSTAAR